MAIITGGAVRCFALAWLGAGLLLAAYAVAEDAPQPAGPPIDFSRDIQPVFAEKCLSCHSGEEPEAGLNMGTRDALTAAADSGVVAVVPGKPDDSELIRRISASDPAERMPPEDEKPLTAEEIAKLTRWVTEGAAWSSHWSFRPLAHGVAPAVQNAGWVRNDIDRYILARLEQDAFTPAPEADRYTLIKRLHYDLLGLPPSVAEVDAFVNDTSPTAYEALVDRLLASPHFGERWGRHWLDLAHFADSDGFEKDRARPDAYVYRDWVIKAFNEDLPFDQFTIQQLAGDLLPGSTAKQRIATGFLRQTLTNEEGGVDQEEFRIAACFDRTETVGTVWLGLTVGCIRCHTHKYDPFPHEEYYKLFAFFNGSEEVNSKLPVAADNLNELEQKLQPLEQQLAERYAELAPDSVAWETAERARVMSQPEGSLKEESLKVVAAESAAEPALPLEITGTDVIVAAAPLAGSQAEGAASSTSRPSIPSALPDRATYTVTASADVPRTTGFRLHVVADDRLPAKGAGLAPNGNFVLTGFQAFVVTSDGQSQPLPLHRASADYSQAGFSPGEVLKADPQGRTGWAVGDKANESHWIQFRTLEPLTLPPGATLKFVLAQQHGERHLLGRFRLVVLTGNERGLHIPDGSIADALEMYPEKRIADTRQRLFDYFVTEVAKDERALVLRRAIEEVQKQSRAEMMTVRTIGLPRLPRVTKRFDRGDFLSPREPVRPGTPAVLASFQTRSDSGDRLDLARWLVNPENALTARVAVNHVWQHLFGQGLVRTANDFGARGELPSHPELLDWLAGQFQHDLRWSRKSLIRLIVTSASYRQSSGSRPELEPRDPLNVRLFRQNRFRVESEIVRDLHLAVAGLLAPKIGGPSVFPPMPADLAKLSYANNFTWTNSEGDDRYRRGMYTFFKRTIPHPNLMTFDSPDANVACIQRTVSNTPLQSLTLLNNEVHVESSQALAKRLLSEDPSGAANAPQLDAERLATAMRLCVARLPAAEEVAALERVLAASRAYYQDHADDAAKIVGTHTPANVAVAEAAAWTATMRVVLNLDEFLTRE